MTSTALFMSGDSLVMHWPSQGVASVSGSESGGISSVLYPSSLCVMIHEVFATVIGDQALLRKGGRCTCW